MAHSPTHLLPTCLAEFSNYAELCTFEYAWSNADMGESHTYIFIAYCRHANRRCTDLNLFEWFWNSCKLSFERKSQLDPHAFQILILFNKGF